MKIRVICRNSRLSLVQVEEVKSLLPGWDFEVNAIASLGDKNKQVPLENCNIADFFTRELDEALLKDEADIAVHSAKDLPYQIPAGLEVIALTKGMDKSDSLVSRDTLKLSKLSANPRIGTSSLIRAESIRKLRPDARIVSIRGTIEERIGLIDQGVVDAVVVATCALQRLSLDSEISEILPFETHPLQGNLAIVAKQGSEYLKQIFSPVDVRKSYGKVYLAGFGPGDPELLTVKAQKALEKADIIFFDDLIEKKLSLTLQSRKSICW